MAKKKKATLAGNAGKAEKTEQSNIAPVPTTHKETPKEIGRDLVEEHKVSHHHALKIGLSILAVCFIIVFSFIGYVLTKAPLEPPPRFVETPTVAPPPPAPIIPPKPVVSIGWLFNNSSIENGGTITAIGYLHSVKDEGQVRATYVLADEKGLMIETTGLKGSQIKYYTLDSKDIFTVRGVIRKYQNTFQLEVKDIN